MQVLLLYNPIAGRGRGAECAAALERELADAEHDVVVAPTQLAPVREWLDPLLIDTELLVVIGGDGAVRMAGPAAARTGTTLYQCPLGTENLFAREFGMDRTAARLLHAIEQMRTVPVDLASIEVSTPAPESARMSEHFLLMVSVGFDAEVIHDLAARRKGGITHFSYTGPIVRQLVRWSAPRLSIDVDGTNVVDDQPGFVVIANCRQYARRFDPAARADMTDGLLDVAFFPAPNRRRLVAWALRCFRRTQLDHPDIVYRTGRSITLRCDPPRCFQVDGDAPRASEEGATAARLTATVEPGVLPVLIP